ncbi:MAG TPA: hypothetical protein VGM77_03890 [Gemmatimonadales bacterium]|jgi:hypothetical protein
MLNPRRVTVAGLVLLLAVVTQVSAQGLPDRLSDADFWKLMTTMSEPNGYFQSENMVSNETGFETVIPELVKTVRPGGVYLGVGPEQNFTYIAALHPAMVFIVDIRHQNAIQHLLYKALFDLSPSRAAFVSALFSRSLPASVADGATVDSIFAAVARSAPDSALHARTLAAIEADLTQTHGFALSADETTLLVHNFETMYLAGPDLNYNSSGYGNSYGRGRMPSYGQLMVLSDNAGVERSYLSSDANYQAVRDLEQRNLLVPLTGDFGGPKAIRAVGDYVRAHHAVVTAFYTSNVEQYLFRDGKWFTFEANVATLPIDSTSRFIRSGGAGGAGGRGFGGGGGGISGMRTSLLQSIDDLIRATTNHQITSYADVLGTSH